MKDCITLAKEFGVDLKREGNGWYVGLCPKHNDTHPSLRIAPDGSHWKCFPCNKGGDNISLARFLWDLNYYDALERVHEEGDGSIIQNMITRNESKIVTENPYLLTEAYKILSPEEIDQCLMNENPTEALRLALSRKGA